MIDLEMQGPSPVKQWVLVLWPAFVAACLLEALVFSVVDPMELHWPTNAVQPSRQAIYTLAFFTFWLISAVCSGLVCWLGRTNNAANNTGAI